MVGSTEDEEDESGAVGPVMLVSCVCLSACDQEDSSSTRLDALLSTFLISKLLLLLPPPPSRDVEDRLILP